MTEVPDSVMFPLPKGLPAMGRTRRFCQVSMFVTLLEDVTVNVTCVGFTLSGIIPLLILLLMFFVSWFGSPLILIVGNGQHVVAKTKPAGTLRMMVPVPTSPECCSL